jgi:hypothetical protein
VEPPNIPLPDLPLDQVAAYLLGITGTPVQGGVSYRDHRRAIVVSGNVFEDRMTLVKGSGAIELIQYVLQCNLVSAAGILKKLFGAKCAMPFITASAIECLTTVKPMDLWQVQRRCELWPVESLWPDVRRQLVHTYGLSEEFWNAVHARGIIYADQNADLVVMRWVSEKFVGAWLLNIINGTVLEFGANGMCLLQGSKPAIIFVESVLEALATISQHPQFAVLVLPPLESRRDAISQVIKQGYRIYIPYMGERYEILKQQVHTIAVAEGRRDIVAKHVAPSTPLGWITRLIRSKLK